MGVNGFTSWLSLNDWIPPIHSSSSSGDCCQANLWLFNNGHSATNNDKQYHTIDIPKGSKLAVDGMGMANWLYKVAYFMHLQKLIASYRQSANNNKTTSRRGSKCVGGNNCHCPSLADIGLSKPQIMECLPQSMSYHELEAVTIQFIGNLIHQGGVELDVYWDGQQIEGDDKEEEEQNQQEEEVDDREQQNQQEKEKEEEEVVIESQKLQQKDDVVLATPSKSIENQTSATPTTPATPHAMLQEDLKEDTRNKRLKQRTIQWNALHQFCHYGTISVSKLCPQDFLTTFPSSRLAVSQVQAIVRRLEEKLKQGGLSSLKNVYCCGEADHEIAWASASSFLHQDKNEDDDDTAQIQRCYAVGMDSDYCFFAHTRYIPLHSFFFSKDISTPLHAVCLTRQTLAQSLGLPDHQMVELALFLGTDYVKGHCKHMMKRGTKNIVERAAEELRDNGADFVLTSKGTEQDRAMGYVRLLYNFQDRIDTPTTASDETAATTFESGDSASFSVLNALANMQLTDTDLAFEAVEVLEGADQKDPKEEDPVGRPTLPPEIDLTLSRINSSDNSPKDPIKRPILAYMEKVVFEPKISPLQMLVWDTTHPTTNASVSLKNGDEANSYELEWENVEAAYIMERCIRDMYERNLPTPALLKDVYPMQLFDWGAFQRGMRNAKTSEASDNVQMGDLNQSHNDTEHQEQNGKKSLPIDEYEDDILDAVRLQRVTIIHGETGCGKSSRVPVMLLRAEPPPGTSEIRMFISQPRRIAAKSLVERVRSVELDLRDKFALRMGHGVREYENPRTRAWFVTTGYIVRLLANHPEKFDGCSHLIVDEVHERSVDTDILCLLCRRLLASNPTIRIILMSATMAANMYQEYFDTPTPPIYVGSRRFPINEYFVEDMFSFVGQTEKADLKLIQRQSTMKKCKDAPDKGTMEKFNSISCKIAVSVGRPGSSVLIFVPGMNEIISIMDLVEKVYKPGVRYTCIPIHSDIPFEDQMLAFETPGQDEVKIIIATNAAESSVTLPDVDHVICMGLCKRIEYNTKAHRQILTPAWISQASAIQRAGRTGRVRIGNVYRLYTKNAFENYLDKFEIGEIKRTPLDAVILSIKEMLGEPATPVLMDCLEPPDMTNVERSLKSLYKVNFLSESTDNGSITRLGAFVSSLGIDLKLGSLIGLGIQFGVGPEAIEMAAILSFPQEPWVMSNPLFHEPDHFNRVTVNTFQSKCHFDANLYSEPLAVMNLMWDYNYVVNKVVFMRKFSLHGQRLRRLITTRNSLRNRVAEFLGTFPERIEIEEPPSRMPHGKLVILRILQVWVFGEDIVYSKSRPPTLDGRWMVALLEETTEQELEQVIDFNKHPCNLVVSRKSEQVVTKDIDINLADFFPEFEVRLLSYCAAKDVDAIWCSCKSNNDVVSVYVREGFAQTVKAAIAHRCEQSQPTDEVCFKVTLPKSGNKRGVRGRPCGSWDVQKVQSLQDDQTSPDVSEIRLFTKLSYARDDGHSFSVVTGLEIEGASRALSCSVARKVKKKKASFRSTVVTCGELDPVSQQDLKDLFLIPDLTFVGNSGLQKKHRVIFDAKENSPIHFGGSFESLPSSKIPKATKEKVSSWQQPLVNDIPQGARLLSVLASCRRREHVIIVPMFGAAEDSHKPVQFKRIPLKRDETLIKDFWKRLDTGGQVFIDPNCVPSAAVVMAKNQECFAVAAITLEIKGGCLKVQGLTLLPPGRLFLLLSLLTFGLHPLPDFDSDLSEEEALERKISQARVWLNEAHKPSSDSESDTPGDPTPLIRQAISFNKTCRSLGEELVCYPELVATLLTIFENVDGYDCPPWPNLLDNAFTEENLCRESFSARTRHIAAPVENQISKKEQGKKKKDKQKIKDENQAVETQEYVTNNGEESKMENTNVLAPSGNSTKKKKKKKGGKKATKHHDYESNEESSPNTRGNITSDVGAIAVRIDHLPEAKENLQHLFATNLHSGDAASELELHTTNLIALLLVHLTGSNMSFNENEWEIHKLQGLDECWYAARLSIESLPLVPLDRSAPSWMKSLRPTKEAEAMTCIPGHYVKSISRKAMVAMSNENGRVEKFVAFSKLSTAMRMAGAYWLERQFCKPKSDQHWFDLTFPEMVHKMMETRSRR